MKRLLKKPILFILDKVAQRIASRIVQQTAAETARTMRTTATAVVQETAAAAARAATPPLDVIVDTITERVARLMGTHTGTAPAIGDPHVLFGGVSDDVWLWLNTAGYKYIPGMILPTLPDKDLQLSTGPDTDEACLRRGFKEYMLFKRIFEDKKGSLAPCDAILDFGCGWGRLIRFFMKDVDPSKLWGIDPRQPCIDAASRTNRWCHFELSQLAPPTSFPPDMFDLIFSYSVFSHLREETHSEWLVELKRILKPDGILIATTFPRDHINHYERLRKEGVPPHDPFLDEYYEIYLKLFQDPAKWLAKYDSGTYCYEDFGRGDGDALIPRGYVLTQWTKHFSFLDYIDDPTVCDQNVIVVSKS